MDVGGRLLPRFNSIECFNPHNTHESQPKNLFIKLLSAAGTGCVGTRVCVCLSYAIRQRQWIVTVVGCCDPARVVVALCVPRPDRVRLSH